MRCWANFFLVYLFVVMFLYCGTALVGVFIAWV